MSIKITIEGEKEEIEDELGITIGEIGGETEVSSEIDGLSKKERLVLKAVENNPGALRTINRAAAGFDESPFEYSGEWDEDRKEVRDILRSLRSRGFVKLDDRSYYIPEDE